MRAASETLVIAHRGAWGDAGENTLEAFEAAIALGADMIELDVRRTRDGHLIVFHDARVKGVRTSSLCYDELRAKGTTSRPPLFEEVLELAAARIALDVEIKEPGYVEEVTGLLKAFGVERCLLTSFVEPVLLEAKARAPELRTGLLLAARAPRDLAARARQSRADCLGLGRRIADAATLARAAAAEIPCLVWTVNKAPGLDRYLAHDAVNGVITDRTSLAIERRSRLSERTGPAAQR